MIHRMKVDRSSAKSIIVSWVFLTAVVTFIVFSVYSSGWSETARVPKPNHVRVLLVGIILGLALFANLIGRALSRGSQVFSVRVPLSGILVAGALSYIGIFYADRYLGGNAIGTPDLSELHYLMYEGWGMMFIPLSVVFGLLTMVREGFEKPSLESKKAA
jgi:hypothetical protein